MPTWEAQCRQGLQQMYRQRVEVTDRWAMDTACWGISKAVSQAHTLYEALTRVECRPQEERQWPRAQD